MQIAKDLLDAALWPKGFSSSAVSGGGRWSPAVLLTMMP